MKAALILIPGLLLAAVALAEPPEGQRGGPPTDEQRAERLARMQESLGLSDAQVRQIREIREQGGSREDIHAVLTEEQRNVMKERRAQHRGQGGKQGQGGPHGRGGPQGQGNRPGQDGGEQEDSDES